jgi:tellurite resistance protein
LLVPGIILPYSVNAAVIIWSSGAVLMFLFSFFVFRKWLDNQQEPGSAMPAWIIPIVGTLDVPIVGYRLPIPGIHEICLVFFGIGLVFSLLLMTIIISRLLFQPQLPEALQPTLLILIGPFALAFSGYQSLTGLQDIAASVFFYFDLFLLLIFGSKIFLLAVCCPFRVTWWAVSFPLVALTIAAFRYASHKPGVIFQIIPGAMLVISTLVITYLFLQTLYKIITGRFTLKTPVAEHATQLVSGTHT